MAPQGFGKRNRILGMHHCDIGFQTLARRLKLAYGFEVESIVHSWDNTYSKSLQICPVEVMTVWNTAQVFNWVHSDYFFKKNLKRVHVLGDPASKTIANKENDSSNGDQIDFDVGIFLSCEEDMQGQKQFVRYLVQRLVGSGIPAHKIVLRPHPRDRLLRCFESLEVEISYPTDHHDNIMSFEKQSRSSHPFLLTDDLAALVDKCQLIVVGPSTVFHTAVCLQKRVVALPCDFQKSDWFSVNWGYLQPHFHKTFAERYFGPVEATALDLYCEVILESVL